MATVLVTSGADSTTSADLVLCPGGNLSTGEATFQRKFSNTTSLEEDALRLASAVFAADLALKRGRCEQFTRQINLTVPVCNMPSFQAVRDDLTYALYVLSHDAWTLNFVGKDGDPERVGAFRSDRDGKTLLFSGGLDSFAASIQLGNEGEQVQLVSHITANQVVSGCQSDLFDHLTTCFGTNMDRLAIRVGARNQGSYRFPADRDREETQRTRSFLFVALAALAARRRGFHDVVLIAENGQMAIHLPLTAARISAFSTHTAHPDFVAVSSDVFSRLLSFQIRIFNPFLYMTKAEVVRGVTTSDHKPLIARTISCWKGSRQAGKRKHCGYCIPCIVRRIALEHEDSALDEYQRDLFADDLARAGSDDEGKRNLCELAEFVTRFERKGPQAHYERDYPELLNEHIDAPKAIAMYRRFAQEARSVIDRHPTIAPLLR